jgi:hypothetical protein
MFWYSVLRTYYTLFHVHIIIQAFHDCKLIQNFHVISNLYISSLPNFATTKYSISHSVPIKDLTSNILEWHLLYIKMWSLWLFAYPCGEVLEYFTHDWFFDVSEFTTQTPLSLLHTYSHSQLKICPPPTFLLKYRNKIFMSCFEKWSNTNFSSL